MSKMRNRWLALGLAVLMSLPTNSTVAFAGQQAEVVAVSGNEADAQKPGTETEAGTGLDGDEQTADGEQTDAQGNLQMQGEDLDAETANQFQLFEEELQLKEGDSFYAVAPSYIQVLYQSADQPAQGVLMNKCGIGETDAQVYYRVSEGNQQLLLDGSDVDITKAGAYKAYLKDGEESTEIKIQVAENDVESIAIDPENSSFKKTYIEGTKEILGSTFPFTVTYKNGETEDFDWPTEEGIARKIIYKDAQGANCVTDSIEKLPVGSYTVHVYAYGREASYAIQVVANPVEKVEIIKGQTQTTCEGATSSALVQEIVLSVTYRDEKIGTKEVTISPDTYTELVDKDYSEDPIEVTYDNLQSQEGEQVSYDLRYLPVGEYEGCIHVYGHSMPYHVAVKESPIKSITAVVPEKYCSYVECEETYISSWSMTDARLLIQYNTDAADKVISFQKATEGYYDTVMGQKVRLEAQLEKDGETVWNTRPKDLGMGEYEMKLKLAGKVTSFPISIVENPVESFTVTVPKRKAVLQQNTYYSSVNGEGFVLNVTYKDGTTGRFTVEKGNKWTDKRVGTEEQRLKLYLEGEEDSDEDIWIDDLEPGDYTVMVEAYGLTSSFTLTVQNSPIAKIEPILEENTSFYEGESYTALMELLNGIRIYYTNGTVQDRVFTSDDALADVRVFWEDDEEERHWYLDNITVGSHTGHVTYMGKEATFDFSIEESPLESMKVSVQDENASYIVNSWEWLTTEGMTLDLQFKDKKIGSKTLQLSGETEWYDPDIPDKKIELRQKLLYTADYDGELIDTDQIESGIKIGTYEVTVYAYGKQAIYQIKVENPPITKLTLQDENWPKEYIAESEEVIYNNPEDLQVTFKNGETKGYLELVSEGQESANIYADAIRKRFLDENGEEVPVTEEDEEKGIPLRQVKPGKYAVEYSLYGNKVLYQFEVIQSPVTFLKIAKEPVYKQYFEGNSVWGYKPYLEGLELTVGYQNEDSKTIAVEDYMDAYGHCIVDGHEIYFDKVEQDEACNLRITYNGKVILYPLSRNDFSGEKVVPTSTDSMNKTVISDAGDYVIYKLTPEETQIYYIYSKYKSSCNYIYDAEGRILDVTGQDENGIMSVYLQEGRTYYLFTTLEDDQTGEYLTIINDGSEPDAAAKKSIDQVSLQIPQPEDGKEPAKWTDIQTAADAGYLVEIPEWYFDDMPVWEDDCYTAGTAATVKLELTPLAACQFTAQTKVTINGKKIEDSYISADGKLSITYAFPTTTFRVILPSDSDKAYTVTSDQQDTLVQRGDSFGFTVKPASGQKLTVKANGTILYPDNTEKTHYTVSDIESNIAIAVVTEEPKADSRHAILRYYNGDVLYDQVAVIKGRNVYEGTSEKGIPTLKSYADDKNQFFLGWYRNNGTLRLTENTKLQSDMSVYAKWTDGIFTKTVGNTIITYKIVSVADNGKMTLEIISAKADDSALESDTAAVSDTTDIDCDGAGEIRIPSGMDVEGFRAEVVAISSGAFQDNAQLTNVQLPDTVKSIGENAFAGCNGLTSVTVPDSVQTIGKNAFAAAESSKQVMILCSTEKSEEIGQAIEAAGAKITKLDMMILDGANRISIPVEEKRTVSANAILNEAEDVSNEITWSVADEDVGMLRLSETAGKQVEVEAVAPTVDKDTATLIATCRGLSKKIIIVMTKLDARAEDFSVELNKESCVYRGEKIRPTVDSIVYQGEKLAEDEYKVTYPEDEENCVYISLARYDLGEAAYVKQQYDIIYPAIEALSFSEPEVTVQVGEPVKLSATCSPAYIKNPKLYWSTGDKEVVSQVNLNGMFKAEKPGQATVTVSSVENEAVKATCKITVVEKKDDPGKDDPDKDDPGKDNPGKQDPGKSDEKHTCTFDAGKVTKQPSCMQAGEKTYTCTVCGKKKMEAIAMTAHVWTEKTVKATPQKNGYTAKVCKNCNKETDKKEISSPAMVELSKELYSYNGKVCKPSVKVKDAAGKEVASANYDVTYANNKKIGDAKVTVTFKGTQYEGSLTKTFTIASPQSKVSKAKAAKKSITVTWKKQKKNVSGYQIQYSTSKKFDKAVKTKTVKGTKKTTLTISKLKAKKTYYVRIRTYKTIKGKKYCSAWSKAKKVKTK